jgi:hypothetical protein
MRRIYICELVTGCLLISVVETYFWTQGRTFILDTPTMKIGLLLLYGIFAVGSQAVLSAGLHLRPLEAIKGNLLVAAIISAGLTGLSFLLHPAVVKDVSAGPVSTMVVFAKFFGTIGIATIALRFCVATIAVRRSRIDHSQKLQSVRRWRFWG